MVQCFTRVQSRIHLEEDGAEECRNVDEPSGVSVLKAHKSKWTCSHDRYGFAFTSCASFSEL